MKDGANALHVAGGQATVSICLLGGFALFAGCLGGASAPPAAIAPPAPETAPAARMDAETCALFAVLLDDEELPIADAEVSLVGPTAKSTRSAKDGSFSFSFLEPGRYQLAVKHERFQLLVQGFDCLAEKSVDLSLRLAARLPDLVPRFSLAQQAGRIGCSLGTPGTGTGGTDYCDQLNLDSNAQSTLWFQHENATVTAAVYELEWTATAGPLSGHWLTMVYPAMQEAANLTTTHRHTPAHRAVTGPSILRVEVAIGDMSRSLYSDAVNSAIPLVVRAGADNTSQFVADPLNPGSVEVVYQQEFTAYVAFFYDGMVVPAGFSPRSA